MMTFGVLMIILSVCIYCRRQHQKVETQRFKYKLFEIRDKLRMYAIDDIINKNSLAFDYYDHSISKSIHRSYDITLPWILGIAFTFNNDKHEHIRHLMSKIEEETIESAELQEIRKGITGAMVNFLVNQHFIIFKIVVPILKALVGSRATRNNFNNIINSSLYNPETSDSSRYAEYEELYAY